MCSLNLTLIHVVAFPLIPAFGFTRVALRKGLELDNSALDALFGPGRQAEAKLINSWLDDARSSMRDESRLLTVSQALHRRLEQNEPVLNHLSSAFATLASPDNSLLPLDPRPAMTHAFNIADEACFLSGERTLQLSWYARRAPLAGIYAAAELHQIASPETAHSFLDGLLSSNSKISNVVEDAALFSEYFTRSWAGLFRSRGML
ncbi:hypothetical protein DL96DRAFT_1667836 [Flagelloscypha sp. PMI_526]|nr:hypothetical protein DL96DRAFT_1667836 [Flagelloscypha sp. PMI_526]